MKKIQCNYYRWILRFVLNTPTNILYCEKEELFTEWMNITAKYEENVRNLEEDRSVKQYWLEKANEKKKTLIALKETFYNNIGLSIMEIEFSRGDTGSDKKRHIYIYIYI